MGAKDRSKSKSSKRESVELEKRKIKDRRGFKKLIKVEKRLDGTVDNLKVLEEHKLSKVVKAKKTKLKSNKKRRRENVDDVEVNNADHFSDEVKSGLKRIDSTGDSPENSGRPQTTCDLGCPTEANTIRKIEPKKPKKGGKKRRKDLCAVNEDVNLDGHISEADEELVDQISAVDEDCSKRMKTTGDSLENSGRPQTTCDLGCPSEANTIRKIKPKKHKKGGKKRRKDLCAVNEDVKLDGHISEADEELVDQISAVDEDCSKGMKKWLREYKERRPGLKILQQRIDDFITAYEEQQEQARKEREALAAEDGWTVVVHHKGRKKTTDSESGTTMGSVAQAAVLDKMAKKKSKDVDLDFYRFRKREAQRNEVMVLRSKFEQDRKRIQKLRAERIFKPQ